MEIVLQLILTLNHYCNGKVLPNGDQNEVQGSYFTQLRVTNENKQQ